MSLISQFALLMFIGTMTCLQEDPLVVMLSLGFGFSLLLMIFCTIFIFLFCSFGNTSLSLRVSLTILDKLELFANA